jgi:hypothetical protein
MATFGVLYSMRVGVIGGYSVSWTSFCSEIGRVEIPLTPLTDSGDIDLRYAKNKWLVASAAL